jgi:hypothetical protein
VTIPTVRTRLRFLSLAMVPALVLGLAVTTTSSPASAAPTSAIATQKTVNLGAAARFAVLAAATVTNTGPSVITGDLGVSPGTAVTGFPPGRMSKGAIHSADSAAAAAQISLTHAYADAASRTPTATVGTELGGKTFGPGIYSNTTLGITGTVTLNAKGNPKAVFIFQSASTLITASSSVVRLTGGAKASNVFWQVGSSATLGTYSKFVGTIMAYASVTDTTGVSVTGRLLVETAAVTLDTNAVTKP